MRAAWISLIALVGCGQNSDVAGDAPTSNDAVDAASDAGPDAPWQLGTVSVTVTDNGAPVPNLGIYFQHPDSSLAAKVLTGQDGVASATVAAGGFVTLVDPYDGAPVDHYLYTWAGVKPDDQLRYDMTSAAGPGLGVSFTAPVDPTATSYRLHASCVITFSDYMLPPDATHPTPYLTNSQWPECVGDGTDLLVETLDASDRPLRYLYLPNVDLTDGDTFNITGTYASPVTTTRTWTNLPLSYVESHTEMWTVHGTAAGYGSAQFGSNGTVTISSERPAIPGAVHHTTTRLLEIDRTRHTLLDWGPGTSSSFDVAGVLLPEAVTPPTFDATTRRVSWTTSGSGATPDATHTFMSVNRPGKRIDWTVLAPYEGGATEAHFTVPDLPQDLDSIEPIATDEVHPYVNAIKTDGGYDAIRQRSMQHAADSTHRYATTATGQATIATYDSFP